MKENEAYLSQQIITYLGNKRKLLPYISKAIEEIKKVLQKEKLDCADLFSGSGVVARLLKQHSDKLYVNDREAYSNIINECYLTNHSAFDESRYRVYAERLQDRLKHNPKPGGIIATYYAPQSTRNIQEGERCFYTHENAVIIDTLRDEIELIEPSYQKFFLAPLLYEASVHTNTAGTFKGFYSYQGVGRFGGKGNDAYARIIGQIEIEKPVLSTFECDVHCYQEDANLLVTLLPHVDVMYLDPPYNQHSYSSNYHILNTIYRNQIEKDSISKVSGIPSDVHTSIYNKKALCLEALEKLVNQAKASYLIISYSSDGFITSDEMQTMLSNYGKVKIERIAYPTYKGSRNYKEKKTKERTVVEYLFILHKDAETATMLDVKRKLSSLLPYISLSAIAKEYFGKNRTWLYHKLNADCVNGKRYQFTPEELSILQNALNDVAHKMKYIASTLIANQ